MLAIVATTTQKTANLCGCRSERSRFIVAVKWRGLVSVAVSAGFGSLSGVSGLLDFASPSADSGSLGILANTTVGASSKYWLLGPPHVGSCGLVMRSSPR